MEVSSIRHREVQECLHVDTQLIAVTVLYQQVLDRPTDERILQLLSYLNAVDAEDLVEGLYEFVCHTRQKPCEFVPSLNSLIERHARNLQFSEQLLRTRLECAVQTLTLRVETKIIEQEIAAAERDKTTPLDQLTGLCSTALKGLARLLEAGLPTLRPTVPLTVDEIHGSCGKEIEPVSKP